MGQLDRSAGSGAHEQDRPVTVAGTGIRSPSVEAHTSSAGAGGRRADVRSKAGKRIDLGRWPEPIAVAGAVGIYTVAVALVIARAERVYLPPDAAHALGEADQLLGRGVLDF